MGHCRYLRKIFRNLLSTLFVFCRENVAAIDSLFIALLASANIDVSFSRSVTTCAKLAVVSGYMEQKCLKWKFIQKQIIVFSYSTCLFKFTALLKILCDLLAWRLKNCQSQQRKCEVTLNGSEGTNDD